MNNERKSENLAILVLLIVAMMLFLPILPRGEFPVPANEPVQVFAPVNLTTEMPSNEFDINEAVEEYIAHHTPKYVFPLDGDITSAFAYRTDPITLNSEEYHLGIDISAKRDIEISSYADGVVKRTVMNDKDYGIYVIIEHDGFETLYAHCSDLLVSQGDEVKAGEVIAIAGSTGRSTGVHLHFEVRVDGKRVDPLLHMSENGVEHNA